LVVENLARSDRGHFTAAADQFQLGSVGFLKDGGRMIGFLFFLAYSLVMPNRASVQVTSATFSESQILETIFNQDAQDC